MNRPSKLDQHKERLDEWFFLSEPRKLLREAREELRKDGFSVSLDALSRWVQRREKERDREIVGDVLNDWSEEFEATLKQYIPGATQDATRQAAIAFLRNKGLATGNDKLALLAIDREQQEISGRTKAKFKERELAIAEVRLRLDTDAWAESTLKKAAELNSSSLSNADKIAAMRQALFADIEALAKSGKVQIPT